MKRLAALILMALAAPALADAPKLPAGMVWVPPGTFAMGSDAPGARPDERPVHHVKLHGYWIDATPVTNAEFRKFVKATHHVTTAERPPTLEEVMAQLPPGTPPPPKEALVAASMVFNPPAGPVPLDNPLAWWAWVPRADWRHPAGPGSDLAGLDDHPVTQVSWDDAVAYAKWAGKRLPTEAEFERAARGGLDGKTYAWGDAPPTAADPHCNTWQGHFPDKNTAADGYARTSPVHAFAPNGYGLYDAAGNVWEWTADRYAPDAYAREAEQGIAVDPAGPADPNLPERVIRGGSFLCNASYCAGYRVSARMCTTPDTAAEHTGFRCVRDGPPPVAVDSK